MSASLHATTNERLPDLVVLTCQAWCVLPCGWVHLHPHLGMPMGTRVPSWKCLRKLKCFWKYPLGLFEQEREEGPIASFLQRWTPPWCPGLGLNCGGPCSGLKLIINSQLPHRAFYIHHKGGKNVKRIVSLFNQDQAPMSIGDLLGQVEKMLTEWNVKDLRRAVQEVLERLYYCLKYKSPNSPAWLMLLKFHIGENSCLNSPLDFKPTNTWRGVNTRGKWCPSGKGTPLLALLTFY